MSGKRLSSMPEISQHFAIQLNGEEYTIEGDAGLVALLDRLKMRRGRVAVEINQAVIPRAQYDAVKLKPGDTVEVINFVGGG
jgi:sulfur carrier protein